MNTEVMFSSHSPHYGTPREIYADLDVEFHFNDDPCPFHGNPQHNLFIKATAQNGLERDWGTSTFVNPPYGRELGKWIAKGYSESRKGKTIVFLIPSRTDTVWWHDYVMKADEIRFIRGRLKFDGAIHSAPFPSCIAVFRGE